MEGTKNDSLAWKRIGGRVHLKVDHCMPEKEPVRTELRVLLQLPRSKL